MPTFFDKLRSGLHRVQSALFASPLNPPKVGNVTSGGQAPEGLELLHSTLTVAEAEMLSQVLTDAGFHVEFVPSIGTGAFGTTGNNCIYVPSREYAEANAFLQDFLNSEPGEEDK